jgi:hypothetical protein
VVLEGGVVVEAGSHQQLLGQVRPGLARRVFMARPLEPRVHAASGLMPVSPSKRSPRPHPTNPKGGKYAELWARQATVDDLYDGGADTTGDDGDGAAGAAEGGSLGGAGAGGAASAAEGTAVGGAGTGAAAA